MKANRVLIIYRVDLAKIEHQGIAQKMKGQASGFRNVGIEVDAISINDGKIMLNDSDLLGEIYRGAFSKFRFFNQFIEKTDLNAYDICLIRYGLSTPGLIKFIKKLKSIRPSVKVIIDMPTYPYVLEWSGIRGRLAIWLDHLYSKSLKKYTDLIIHSGPESRIFDIPVMQMSNGINVDTITLKKTARKKSPLQMIAVGKWQYWHGLDRLLLGLKDQNHRDAFILHIVGHGPELVELHSLAVKLKLGSCIVFHGPLIGPPLDDLFDQCHLAIGTLGIHRKEVKTNSSLKHRDYCARGIPFILSGHDSDFEPTLSFVYYVPDNDDPICLNEIVAFKDAFEHDPDMIRSYAEEHLGWDDKIRNLLTTI